MEQKILVTGATGNIGRALVEALHLKNASFIAGVRDVEKGKEQLGGQTEVVRFDFEDTSTYQAATEGVGKVFLLGPPLAVNLDSLLAPFIGYLKDKGLNKVVYVSALGIEHVKDLPFHANVIDMLKGNGFEYTILRPSFFSQNFKNYEWENIMQRGITYVSAGNGKVAFVDVNDIAAVAAAALTEDGHSGKTYDITGPEALSYTDAAALLSELTGKTIVYPNPSPEEYTLTLKAAGAPDFVAPYMNSIYSLIADNKVNTVSTDVEKITGRKPVPLKEVLQKDFAGTIH